MSKSYVVSEPTAKMLWLQDLRHTLVYNAIRYGIEFL